MDESEVREAFTAVKRTPEEVVTKTLGMPDWFQWLAVFHVGRRSQGYDRNSITGQRGWCGISASNPS
jgi:hypothetical protein